RILEGIVDFSKQFKGEIITETMILNGIEYGNEFEEISYFIDQFRNLDKAYIAVPTRPPAESWVRPAKEDMINHAFQVFSEKLGPDKVECLIGYEGNAFASTGKAEEDLLSITAVHPMRKEAVAKLLKKTKADWRVVERLLEEEKLIELGYEGNIYYMRSLPSRRKI
ncbi:MAG: radical SAM protein, partial [Candidatus Korarchaeota archaeon]|nr:radical SAM protein [Candidatus Korarchaeota archaeon]NIW13073.1 radical SAM protein [Candidatus Thorarchaeota archaeon]